MVALYGHGFCTHLRSEMFRKLLRHGAAYFDEECNTPGRLTHKLIGDTASLQTVSFLHLKSDYDFYIMVYFTYMFDCF